jgi:hypothetical protein
MREINESWSVLRDAASRRRYDESRLVGSRTRAPASPRTTVQPRPDPDDDDLVDVAPPVEGLVGALFHHLPWIVLVVVLVGIFVVTAYATGGDRSSDHPATTTTVAAAGTCLQVAAGPVATPVPCSGPYDVRVVARVDEMTACPRGTERRRLFHDSLLDCVSTP